MCPQLQDGNLSADFLDIFLSGRFSDVVIRLGHREMHLHSLVLMTRSPVFATIFKEHANCDVEIDDVNFETATHFFKFLYSGVTTISTFSECVELFKVAKKYGVTCLEKRMKDQIIEYLSTDNCLEALLLANDYNSGAIRDAALNIASGHVTVTDDPRFMELDKDTMRCLFEVASAERDAALAERDPIAKDWVQNFEGSYPLHEAAKEGRLDVVKFILKVKRSKVDEEDFLGQTPLHKAAWKGYLEIVQHFIEDKGAKVEAKDKNGETALHSAAMNGHLDIVRYLVVDKGANVKAKDKSGRTPIYLARMNNRDEVVNCLEGRNQSATSSSSSSLKS
eukprot:Selendium_serpulae@DN6423_c3_g2_i1.p1